MKHLKMMGLAAIAVLGLLAFVGAGTASATTLFEDEARTKPLPAGTTIEGTLKSGTSATLTSGSTTIATCTGSTVSGSTENETGTTVKGPISSLTWEGCTQTTHTAVKGSLEVESTGGGNGRVIGKGNQVTLGIFGTTCTYGTGEGTELGTIASGATPHLTITVTVLRTAGGFLCPSTGIWHATYVIIKPDPFVIGS